MRFDTPRLLYPLDYDGYGYSDFEANSPLSLADRLMDSMFAKGQLGMEIAGIQRHDDILEVFSTGARFEFTNSTVHGYQTIDNQRSLFKIEIDGVNFSLLKQVKRVDGYVILQSSKAKIRINGDGIFMIKATSHITCTVTPTFSPDYYAHNDLHDSYVFLDEWGGFGLYLFGRISLQNDDSVLVCSVDSGQIFWAAVFPPREDKEIERKRILFYYGANRPWDPVYPTMKEFRRWSGINDDSLTFKGADGRMGTNPDHIDYGEIVALVASVNLWKSWHIGYVPRTTWSEFHKTITSAHAMGKRIIFYVSPVQFYRGSRYYVAGSDYYLGDSTRPILIRDMSQIYDQGHTWPPGNPEGENIDSFLRSVADMVNHERCGEVADGIYVDGLYFLNIPQSYILMRRLREILGEERIICLHAAPLPGGDAYLRQIDAYADYVVRGEGGRDFYQDSMYFKYFIRTRHMSNAFGIFINQKDRDGNYNLISSDLLQENLLRNNLDVYFDAPVLDLASRWDTKHDWAVYRAEVEKFQKILYKRK